MIHFIYTKNIKSDFSCYFLLQSFQFLLYTCIWFFSAFFHSNSQTQLVQIILRIAVWWLITVLHFQCILVSFLYLLTKFNFLSKQLVWFIFSNSYLIHFVIFISTLVGTCSVSKSLLYSRISKVINITRNNVNNFCFNAY